MHVGEYCTRGVIVAHGTTEVRAIAQLMRDHHVGSVVVVEGSGAERRPVGIVTDRDLVIEIIAPEVDLDAVSASDLCTGKLVVAKEGDDLMVTLERMRAEGVRRVPVVDDDGILQGLLAADDLLPVVGEMITDLSRLVIREVDREIRTRP